MGEQTAPAALGDQSGRWLTRDRDSGRDHAEKAALTGLLAGIRDRVLGGAHLQPGNTVLDLGAGTGLLTHAVTPEVEPAGVVVAVDISTTALAHLTNTSPSAYAVAGDACHLPVASATIDRVVARSVLIYLHDLHAALHEVARVLKPGGVFSVFEPVNAGRHHDAHLNGVSELELHTIDQLRRTNSATAAPMMAFSRDLLIDAADRAGFTTNVDEAIVTDHLTTHEQVNGYLNRIPHPGAVSPLDLITEHLGHNIATRYTTAWHHALDHATDPAGIAFTTPVLYLTAHLTAQGPDTGEPTSDTTPGRLA